MHVYTRFGEGGLPGGYPYIYVLRVSLRVGCPHRWWKVLPSLVFLFCLFLLVFERGMLEYQLSPRPAMAGPLQRGLWTLELQDPRSLGIEIEPKRSSDPYKDAG